MAEVMRRALDQILPPPVPFDLVGFSFGGIIAGLIAAGLKSRIGTLVLVGAGGLGVAVGPVASVLRVGPDATREQIQAADRHNLAVLLLADPSKIDDLALRVYRDNVSRTRFSMGAIPASDVLARALPATTANVVAVYGERDQFACGGLDVRRRIFRAVQPGTYFHVVPGAGHWVPYEQPDAFNRLLFDWVMPPDNAR
jgi:pimeloyl-ACP methyl ester carboxylesterase